MFRDESHDERHKGKSLFSTAARLLEKKYTIDLLSSSLSVSLYILSRLARLFTKIPTMLVINSLATRRKMFSMGPKTQRNLSFSSKTIEKSIPAAA
jgi:hypothetical protein